MTGQWVFGESTLKNISSHKVHQEVSVTFFFLSDSSVPLVCVRGRKEKMYAAINGEQTAYSTTWTCAEVGDCVRVVFARNCRVMFKQQLGLESERVLITLSCC